jgi:hypothetical protein
MRIGYLALSLTGLVLAVGCGGTTVTPSATTPTQTTPPPTTSPNVLAINVDGGPEKSVAGGSVYQNEPFASATICAPGSTTSCVTINGLLVDTGQSGIVIFDSAVTSLHLPAVNAANGSPAFDCVNYSDGTYLWGSVQQADVTLGGETAAKLPINVINSSGTVPDSCSNGGNINLNTALLLGANGIIGVGFEPTDCYLNGASICDPSSSVGTPLPEGYYTCSGGTCNPAFVAKANQVTNPVVLFPKDNNGVIVELPSASSPAASISGSLIFGIGTQSNNQLPSGATTITMACDDFATVFNGQTFGVTDTSKCTGPFSTIDTGSNGIYFANVTSIPACPAQTSAGNLSSLYCPTATQNLSATIQGQDGKSKSVDFSIANAQTLLTGSATASDAVLPGLGGPRTAGLGFVWGLPFFYGKNVYFSIAGQTLPSGMPAGPWWAF